jgi:hypothetical protein
MEAPNRKGFSSFAQGPGQLFCSFVTRLNFAFTVFASITISSFGILMGVSAAGSASVAKGGPAAP